MIRLMPGDKLMHLVGMDDYYYLLEHDPAELERIAHKYGLSDPMYIQYLKYLKSIVTLDFGISYTNNLPVIENVARCIKWTLYVTVPTLIFGGLIGGVLGVIAGWKPGGIFDSIMTPIAMLFHTIPNSCVCILMILVFSYKLDIFPIGGMMSGMLTGRAYVLDVLWHMALPLIIVITYRIFGDFNLMKTCVSQVRKEDYTITAAAKGLPEKKILFRHVLRNAMVPYMTSMCMQMGGLLSGSMIVESVFGWRGMGQLYYSAVSSRDYPTAQLCFLISATSVVLATLLSDIVIAIIDPRVKEQVDG